MTFICWPRNIDVSAKGAKPYPGWPFTFNQIDNYGRKAVGHLPSLEISKPDQVVQVIEERSGQVVYTLRTKGQSFQPKVFAKGSYTVKVGEGSALKTFKGVKSLSAKESKGKKIQVKL